MNSVVAGVRGHTPIHSIRDIPHYQITCHEQNGKLVMEIRPRVGQWYPFVFMVPVDDHEIISIQYAPSGKLPYVSSTLGETPIEAKGYKGVQIANIVNNHNSAFITLSGNPREIVFGSRGDELCKVARDIS